MKPKTFFANGRFAMLVVIAANLIFFSSLTIVNGQTNFTGRWNYEKEKSIPDKLEPDWDGSIVLVITQTKEAITFSEIYTHPERPDWETGEETYNLDGKEKVRSSEIGTNRNSATWSVDGKSLTVSNIDTQELNNVMQDFIVTDTYSLSSDGKVLTIERYRKNPVTGETKAKKVYVRK